MLDYAEIISLTPMFPMCTMRDIQNILDATAVNTRLQKSCGSCKLMINNESKLAMLRARLADWQRARFVSEIEEIIKTTITFCLNYELQAFACSICGCVTQLLAINGAATPCMFDLCDLSTD